MKIFLPLFAFTFAAICAASAMTNSPTPTKTTISETARELQSANKLFSLLNARLGLMRGVALAKWRSGGAIEDLPREQIVMRNAGQNAAREGLQNIDALTRTQIEMAKEVQCYWHRRWASEGLDGSEIAPPLSALRAQLETLDAQILVSLRDALPILRKAEHNAKLQTRLRQVFLRRLTTGAFTNAQRTVL